MPSPTPLCAHAHSILRLTAVPFAALLFIAAGATITPATTYAQASNEQRFDIPAGALGSALNQYAAQSGVPVSADGTLIKDRVSAGLTGNHSGRDALNQLLDGTGLIAVPTDNGGYVLQPAPQGATVLPAVRIEGAHRSSGDASSEGTRSYTARATTIGKTAQTLREIPQSVSVVTRQQLDDRNVVTLEDAMRYATGVAAFGNQTGATTFYARGGVLERQFDGVPALATIQTNEIDMVLYDRAEVFRGPNGLLQGSGSSAGTINLVRKRAQNTRMVSTALMGGSWNNYRGDLDVTGPLNASGSLRGRAIVSAQDREFFYDDADSRTLLGSVMVEFDPIERATLGVSYTQQDTEVTPFSGFPTYTDGGFLDLPRSTNLDARYSNGQRDTQEISAFGEYRFSGDWIAKATFRYQDSDFDRIQGKPSSAVNRETGATEIEQGHTILDTRNTGFDVHASGSFELFARRHTLTVGANTQRTETHTRIAVAPYFNSDNWFDPGYDASTIPAHDDDSTTAFVYNNRSRNRQSGLYGIARIRVLDPLTVVLGSRFTDYSNETRALRPIAQNWVQGAKTDAEWTPYGGIVFDATKTLSLYASYSDIFRPQTTIDFYGDVLEPVVGWQIETGLKGEFFDGALNSTAALFRIRDKNAAVNDPDPTHNTCGNAGTSQCQVAGGLTEHEGWELDFSGSPLRGLELTAGYTYFKSTPRRSNNASLINVPQASRTFLPRRVFKIWADYQFSGALKDWSAGGGIHAMSETNGGLIHQGGVTTASLQAGYVINQHLKTSLTINNLTDKIYYHQLNDPRGFNNYGEPSNVMLTLRGQW